MNCALWLLIGVMIGISIAATVAGFICIELTPGNDHPLTNDEIRERVGEVFE